MTKKTSLTRTLMTACSILALSAVMYGCTGSGDDAPPAAEMPPPVDTDGDGVADDDDAFPNDPNETADADGDGVGDNAQEAMALDAAQDAAMAAWEMARDALASIAGDESENPVAYQRAMNALADAKAAYDAAAAATTSADAEMYQANAEAARDTATTQVAGVVYSRDMEAIGAARMAAEQAAQAAKRAYEAAKMALAAVEDFKALDMASYDMAMAQVTAAKMAYDAAMAASNQAADAMLLGDAESQRDAARTAMGNADDANTNAMKYAGMVQDAENAALADARMKADEAYMAAKVTAGEARQAANDADAEATAAEEANVGSPAAMDSRTAAKEADDAATDADDAATDAGTAKMAADAAATSAEARGHQAMAEEEKRNAEGHLETAQMKLAAAEAAKITAQNTGAGTILLWQQRAMDANDDAAGYATAARAAANKADAQADTAEADAARAMRARTDYANANKKAMAARTAANAAETAAKAAEGDAKTASNALAMATADDATVAVAREQSNIARAAAMGASGEPAKANTGYMDAMEAAGEAKMYAGRHVIGLLSHANGQDILDVDKDVATAPALRKLREARIKAVSEAIVAAAGSATDADNDSTTETAGGDDSASATWVADTPDDPDTDNDNEFVAGLPIVTVTGVGTTGDIVSETRASDADADTAIVNNADKIRGLPDFMQGFDITAEATDGDRHVIAFTDIEQAEPQSPQVFLGDPVTIINRRAVASRVVIPAGTTIPSDGTLPTAALYDHDGDPDTNGLTATYACGSTQATDCSFEIEDGKITSLVGYVVSVNIDATTAETFPLKAEVLEMADMTYLAFGVWLNEADSDDTTDGVQPSFGAFAGGGARLGAVDLIAVTGTAKYTGAATGVYTAGTSVDYFQGDATLTASFGPAAAAAAATPAVTDADAQGSISGTINNIVAGGTSMSHVINLNSAALGSSAADGFNGNARMGKATVKDNVATYTYNGHWGGHFYNQAMDDDDTTADESETTAPGSVAGTFGVTGTMGEGDDAMTRSYVGAFGAHKD